MICAFQCNPHIVIKCAAMNLMAFAKASIGQAISRKHGKLDGTYNRKLARAKRSINI